MYLEQAYDGDLAWDVHRLRVDWGYSWRDIAEHVGTKTGYAISHESLRQWYGHTVDAA